MVWIQVLIVMEAATGVVKAGWAEKVAATVHWAEKETETGLKMEMSQEGSLQNLDRWGLLATLVAGR